MSAALHLAGPDDITVLTPLVAAFHAEAGIEQDAATREAALMPLLAGSPYGAVYLLGMIRAPIGYVVVTFGWSVEFGGMDGFVDEIFIRPKIRGRGIATETLMALPKVLAEAGVRALHLEVDRHDDAARRLYARAGFQSRERYMLMSRRL